MNSLMLLAGRRTDRIFGALPLPPGADTPELVIEETLRSPAVRGLDPILHLSEDHGLEEVLREMHCRRTPVLQRAGDPGSAMAPVLAAAKEKLRTAPELFPDDPESRGVTDVSLSQPSPELTPVHLSVVEDESGERARQESREELEGIMRKLNASGNLSDLSEYEQELARGFLVPEKAAGDAFRCRVDEERFAEVTAHFGILWFLSNFSLSVAEARRLEMIRLSAEEFLNAESEEFDENSFSRDMSASLEELEGRRFVKFCALLIAQELGRIFLRARERLAELDSETAEDEVVKHLRETLASNSQADILAALDRAVREAGDEGREIIERVFAPVSD